MPPVTGGFITTGTPESLTLEESVVEQELEIKELETVASGSPKGEKDKNPSTAWRDPKVERALVKQLIKDQLAKSCKPQKTPNLVLNSSKEDLQFTEDSTQQ